MKAVVPRGIPSSEVARKWPAVMKDGKVYVHRFHTEATKAANSGKLGPIDADGWVERDDAGNVIDSWWTWTK